MEKNKMVKCKPKLQIGARAHDFGKLSVEDLAEKLELNGVTSIQLALTKALDGFDVSYGSLTPGMACYIRDTLRKHNINISVLGCYVNVIHPDRSVRSNLLKKFKEHISLARDFGCSIVGTETGSLNADYSYNPSNSSNLALNTLIDSVSILVEEAEKFGVFLGIEGVTQHSICTPERIKIVIDSIQSNNLQVIFDPVNLINKENYEKQDEIIDKSFELFGDKIAVIHSKDFVIDNGKMKVVETGKGIFNYKKLIGILKERKPYINILLENSGEKTFNNCKKYLNNIYENM